MINKICNGNKINIFQNLLLGCMLVAGVGFSDITRAAFTFSQAPVDGNDAFSSISTEQAADDFSLVSSGTVEKISWWGSYASDPLGLPIDIFEVSFFQDNGSGSPAISPFATLTDTVTRTSTGLFEATGAMVYRFDLSVSTPFALTGSTPYYLSVINEFDVITADANWYWLLSDTSGGNYYRFAVNDTWQSDTTGNFAFTLNIATAVPEPANLWLFLIGSALLGLVIKIRET